MRLGELVGAEDAQHVVRASEPRHEGLEVIRQTAHAYAQRAVDRRLDAATPLARLAGDPTDDVLVLDVVSPAHDAVVAVAALVFIVAPRLHDQCLRTGDERVGPRRRGRDGRALLAGPSPSSGECWSTHRHATASTAGAQRARLDGPGNNRRIGRLSG